MAKWTISEYDNLPLDANGNPMQISRIPRSSVGLTVPGSVALHGGRFVRLCGDTAAHVKIGSNGATTNDEYVAAGVDYWFDPEGATSMNFIAG